jgi:uncharacterized protein YbjT (DUF2867 family)
MSRRVLLTGATGFVGGRLQPSLAGAGFEVDCLTRQPDTARAQRPQWHWIRGDVTRGDLRPALEGHDLAYYLVHGLTGASAGWAVREVENAARFAEAARQAGVQRIVYLGAIAPQGPPSEHLWSRLKTGDTLRQGRVPCLELRASMIVGHGSASWRMVRDLAARLPAMVLPAWLRHRTEPVGIDDVIAALVNAATLPLPESTWEDLPGPEILSGREILTRVAALLGHRPLIVEVPFVTPRLSSYWIRLVSGVDYPLARELVAGMTSDIIAERRGFWARAELPPPRPLAVTARRALAEDAAASQMTTHTIERVVDVVTRKSAMPTGPLR